MDFSREYEDFLDRLVHGDKKWTIDRIKRFLFITGNPQENFKSIHISGTNGKGTVSHLLYNVFSQKYKVGLYTSPHLVDFRERILTNDGCIKEEWIAEFIRTYKEDIERCELTYFETATAMAYHYFSEMGVDIAVVEVGLGGEKDATNVINPLISIITYVDYDHLNILGPTLKDIAYQKAGIIKGGYFLTYEEKCEILEIFKEKVREKRGKMFLLGDYINWNIYSMMLDSMKCVFESKHSGKIYDLRTKIVGEHQCKNIGLCLLAVELLSDELSLSVSEIRKGIESTLIPARFQIIKRDPVVIADGAHNPSAISALVNTVEKIGWKPRCILFSMMRDKDLESSIRLLSQICNNVIFTEVNNTRCSHVEEMLVIGKKYFKNVIGIRDLREAYKSAETYGDTLVTGSFYLCGEILKLHNYRVCCR